ncbi:MAG: hypothetical protein K2Y14_05575 [Burkholderiales bacterium]|nr:hypothetical protein [Burkholderiales bacterium]
MIYYSQNILQSEYLSKQPCAKFLVEDLQNSIKRNNVALNLTKTYINSNECNFLVSLFHVPYNPKMNLDACLFRTATIDPELYAYKTNVMPIILEKYSDGFYPVDTVAIFPENHIDGIQKTGEKIFYIVNKFAFRHVNITKKILNKCVTSDSFQQIRELSDEQIEEAVVYWVWFHEYNHQKCGGLPLPKYLTLKTTKFIAGLEELRVDIGGMLLCAKNIQKFGNKAGYIFEFILAERLLRYGVDGVKYNKEGCIVPSYDAVGSYLCFNLLLSNGGISIINNKIKINNNIVQSLEDAQSKIHQLEYQLNTLPEEKIKLELLNFIKSTLHVDELKTYSSDPFFNIMRSEIGYTITDKESL